MKKIERNDLTKLNNKAEKILRKLRSSGYDIKFALVWLTQLHVSIINRDFKYNNSAFIWFKNAKNRNKEFNEVFDIVNKMTAKIYIEPNKLTNKIN